MIRSALANDTPSLIALACGSGLFDVKDAQAIQAMLDDYHASKVHEGYRIITFDDSGSLVGIAYFAPRPFADRVLELLMIAVDAPRQRQGIGSQLLRSVEDEVRGSNGRMLLIETSDKVDFERTRSFYRKHGYAEVALIPDYFTDGDGKASFVKRL